MHLSPTCYSWCATIMDDRRTESNMPRRIPRSGGESKGSGCGATGRNCSASWPLMRCIRVFTAKLRRARNTASRNISLGYENQWIRAHGRTIRHRDYLHTIHLVRIPLHMEHPPRSGGAPLKALKQNARATKDLERLFLGISAFPEAALDATGGFLVTN